MKRTEIKTESELNTYGIYIETYANGFIIAYYYENEARYYGTNMIAISVPMVNNYFISFEEAFSSAKTLII